MNATEERLILDAIQDATHEYKVNNNEYNFGVLRGVDTVASLLGIEPKKVAEAMRLAGAD